MNTVFFKAVINEVGMDRKVIATTKLGTYRGMSKEEFEKAVYENTCFTFVVEEI